MTGRLSGIALMAAILGGASCVPVSDTCVIDGDCWEGRMCRNGHCAARSAASNGDLDAADGGTPDAPDAGADTASDAPSGMVLLSFPGGPSFWIDAYEASLVPGQGELGSASLDSDGDGKIADRKTALAHARSHDMKFDEVNGQLDPNEAGVKLTTVIARSVPFQSPTVAITFWQAASACANADKRLCTSREWLWACSGAGLNTMFSYGNVFDGGDEPGKDCWIKNGPLSLTGSASGCVSPQGVWDMNGNAEEFTDFAGKQINLRGGWAYGPPETSACAYDVEFDATTPNGAAGFRCCKDP